MTAPSDRLEPLPTSELEDRKQLFRRSLFRGGCSGGVAKCPSFPAKCGTHGAAPGNVDVEAARDAPGGRFALRGDAGYRLPRLREDRSRRGFRSAAVEGRLRRVHHVELNGPCGVVTAQRGGEAQSAVDASRDTSGENPVAVYDDPLVDGDRTEVRQQVKRRPMRRRSPSLEQPRRAAEQRASAYREWASCGNMEHSFKFGWTNPA
jgi:hypothetical protein